MKRPQLLAGLALLTCSLAPSCIVYEESPFIVDEPEECSIEAQNEWVLEVMNEFYLWNGELPSDVDTTIYESPDELLVDVRYEWDRWTKIRDKVTSDALFMQGKFIGLGYKTQRGDNDELLVSFVSDNSPASGAGLLRGDRILAVNGKTVVELDETGWSGIYGENEPGVAVDIEVEHYVSGEVETLELTKEWIDIVSIPVVEILDGPNNTPVGYFVMDKFVETTKAELEDAFAQFKEAGVSTVIIDLRYNGGGLISVAERLVNLSLGADHAGEMAYRFEYNDNLADENKQTTIAEHDNSIGADKIVVLTSSRTLSASELVISALLPYAEVTLIGGTTGGKPVGSKSFEFCEKKLYPVTFRLVNAEGNTDYFEGMDPTCLAEDDVFHQLGDPAEGMLAAGLDYLNAGSCAQPAPPPGSPLALIGFDAVGERVLPDPELRDEIDSW